mgnify:CR=1 FL=1
MEDDKTSEINAFVKEVEESSKNGNLSKKNEEILLYIIFLNITLNH